jgi:Na+-driven multidrug efflux pump
VAALLGGTCLLLPEPLARLFTTDEELVAALVPFLVCLALTQPSLQGQFALGGAHRGAGDTWTPFVATSVGNWVVRVPLAFAVAKLFDGPVVLVFWLILADHSLRAVWLAASFRRGRWREALAPANA